MFRLAIWCLVEVKQLSTNLISTCRLSSLWSCVSSYLTKKRTLLDFFLCDRDTSQTWPTTSTLRHLHTSSFHITSHVRVLLIRFFLLDVPPCPPSYSVFTFPFISAISVVLSSPILFNNLKDRKLKVGVYSEPIYVKNGTLLTLLKIYTYSRSI